MYSSNGFILILSLVRHKPDYANLCHTLDPYRFSGRRESAACEVAAGTFGLKEGGYWWKLFHREERPALERNIIDTS